MSAGMAVIASPLPRAALLAATGAGMTASDRDEIAAVLRRWLEDPAEMAALRSAARTWATGREDSDPFDGLLDKIYWRRERRRHSDPAAKPLIRADEQAAVQRA